MNLSYRMNVEIFKSNHLIIIKIKILIKLLKKIKVNNLSLGDKEKIHYFKFFFTKPDIFLK